MYTENAKRYIPGDALILNFRNSGVNLNGKKRKKKVKIEADKTSKDYYRKIPIIKLS